MKKTIYFLRSAPYEYLIPGMSLYQSFDAAARKQYNPELKPDSKKYFQHNVPSEVFLTTQVFSSADKRSIETGKFIQDKVTTLELLKEIRYTMDELISEQDFLDKTDSPQIQKARQAFVQGLINNLLSETYSSVIQRIEKLISLITQIDASQVVLFSHGFYLKVLEAFVRDKDVKNSPPKLLKFFDGTSETFKFCEGFKLEYNGRNLVFAGYIRNKVK